jgi:hypothetical protein
MILLTKSLKKRFAEIGDQADAEDPIIIAKFFNPAGAGTWYAVSYDSKRRIFFGYVSIFGDYCDEWGYFSLDELKSYKGPFGIGIERDLYWTEMKASVAISKKA